MRSLGPCSAEWPPGIQSAGLSVIGSQLNSPRPRFRPEIFAVLRSPVFKAATVLVVLGLVPRLFWLKSTATHVDGLLPLGSYLWLHAGEGNLLNIFFLSRDYTYPPGQYLLTLPLLSWVQSYQDVLFWFRLPSLLAWTAGLGGAFLLVHRVLGPRGLLPALAVSVLALFSWRGWIEGSQGYVYASTFPLTAMMAFFVLTESGRRWLADPLPAFGIGIIWGISLWFSYQMLFVAAASFAFIGLRSLHRRSGREITGTIAAAAGFGIPAAIVYHQILRTVLQWASGTPSWAGGLPMDGIRGGMTFPLTAWFEVVQSNFSFMPWGWPSKVFAFGWLLLVAGGLFRVWRNKALRTSCGSALWWLVAIVVVFTAGPYLGKFPLGATRHSFVLTVPMLLATAIALRGYNFSGRAYSGGLVVGAVVFAVNFLPFWERTRNHVDLQLLHDEMQAAPSARMVDLPGSYTWDHVLLAWKSPQMLDRLKRSADLKADADWENWVTETPTCFLLSHRAPLSSVDRERLLVAGAGRIETLAEQPPVGGTELAGIINGGNGFYLYRVHSTGSPAPAVEGLP